MERLRQTPIKKRVAIGFIAVCALLLQGFLAAKRHRLSPSTPSDGIICGRGNGRQRRSLPSEHHPPQIFVASSLCVAWAKRVDLTATPVLFAFPARKTSDVVFASASEHGARAGTYLFSNFPTRGPPQGLLIAPSSARLRGRAAKSVPICPPPDINPGSASRSKRLEDAGLRDRCAATRAAEKHPSFLFVRPSCVLRTRPLIEDLTMSYASSCCGALGNLCKSGIPTGLHRC